MNTLEKGWLENYIYKKRIRIQVMPEERQYD
jgi:hypothetical protein